MADVPSLHFSNRKTKKNKKNTKNFINPRSTIKSPFLFGTKFIDPKRCIDETKKKHTKNDKQQQQMAYHPNNAPDKELKSF